MARRVLAAFESELLLRLANRKDITADMRGYHLEDAYRWTCASYVHPQIEADTTATQAIGSDLIVPVATNIWWAVLIKNTDGGFNIFPGDKDEIENRTKQTGDPREYYWWNEQFRTERKPTAIVNYSIMYIKKVTMFGTGESPVIDQIFDPIIIMKAAEIGLSTIRDFKEALALAAEIDRYSARFNLPKREDKKNVQRSGFRPRIR